MGTRILLMLLCIARFATGQVSGTGDCQGNLGDNIFLRGDFGTGFANILPVDPRLAPGYTYVFNPPPNDGFYTITNNTSNWGSFAATSWIKTGDNSQDPNGYFMVVNASIQPGLFYLDTVNVCPNTSYLFSADVISMNAPWAGSGFIQPNISFLVNGLPLYQSGNVPVDARWHNYGFSFHTDSTANRIVLALRNNAPGGNGNDLGLDNISFQPCGPRILAPDTVLYRRDSMAFLSVHIQEGIYRDPRVQWQVSKDDGLTWSEVSGATDTLLVLPKPKHGSRYRVLIGDGLSQLRNPSCRVHSEEILVREDAIRDTFHVAICPGGAYEAFGTFLRDTGEYEFFFPSNYQGDRVVTYFVRLEDLSQYQITGPTRICVGDTIELDAGDFGSVTWSTGAVSRALRVFREGTYSVQVTSVFGCSAMDTIQVEAVGMQMELETSSPTCYSGKDGQISIARVEGGSPPYRYGIQGAPLGAVPEITGLGAGTYQVQLMEAGGCMLSLPVVLYNPEPFQFDTAGSVIQIPLGARVTLMAQANQPILGYNWSPTVLVDCPECPNPIVSPDSSTTYTLLATNGLGCTAQWKVRVEVLVGRQVYVPTAFSPNGDRRNDSFAPLFGRGVLEVVAFNVFQRSGALVFAVEHEAPESKRLYWDATLRGGDPAPSGLYLWTALITFADGTTERWSGEVSLIR